MLDPRNNRTAEGELSDDELENVSGGYSSVESIFKMVGANDDVCSHFQRGRKSAKATRTDPCCGWCSYFVDYGAGGKTWCKNLEVACER